MSRFELPEYVFRYQDGESDIMNETSEHTEVEGYTFDKGLFVRHKNAQFPQKGMVTAEMMIVVNLTKRLFIEPIRFLSRKRFLPGLLICLFRPDELIRSYNSLVHRYMKPYILGQEYMTGIALEVEEALGTFLLEICDDRWVAIQFAEIVSHLIEYDNAYRLRLIDILSETTVERLSERPIREINRLAKLMVSRGNDITQEKFVLVARLASLALLFPKYRRAFRKALENCVIERMQYDDIDAYWTMLRKDGYNYMGKTDSERRELLISKGYSFPLLRKR